MTEYLLNIILGKTEWAFLFAVIITTNSTPLTPVRFAPVGILGRHSKTWKNILCWTVRAHHFTPIVSASATPQKTVRHSPIILGQNYS